MAASPSRNRARDFLAEHLVGQGPVPASLIRELAVADGIPLRTLQRCARESGVTFQSTGPKTTLWTLDALPEPPRPLEILSLGAGVQSTTLALLACEDRLPLDAAIFADTGWEPAHVYEHMDRLQAHMEANGIAVYRVSAGDLRSAALSEGNNFVPLPYHTHSLSGKRTMARRQCTTQYKIRPIDKKIRELAGAKPPKFLSVPPNMRVNLWIGFSTDEIHRVSDKMNNWYTTRRFPLLDLEMSRTDCVDFLTQRQWKVAKSSCIGCPFNSNFTWGRLKRDRPDEWANAVEFDKGIREIRPDAWLHPSCKPLEEADLTSRWGGDPDGCSPYGCRSGARVAGSI